MSDMKNPGGPGWNDPPSLSFETHSQTTSRKNMLTKRIGLPDLKLPGSSIDGEKPLLPGSLPPSAPPTGQKLPPKAENNVTDDTKEEKPNQSGEDDSNPPQPGCKVKIFNPSMKETPAESDNKAEEKDTEMTIDLTSMEIDFMEELKNIVIKFQDDSVFSSQVGSSILKKIAILEKQVNEKKIPDIAVKKIEELTKLLIIKRYDDAWNVHLTLICDHSSSVMQWIAGIKKLISEAKRL